MVDARATGAVSGVATTKADEPSRLESPASGGELLCTSIGDFPLQEYRVRIAGREWVALHTQAVLTHADEQHFLSDSADRLPYGVVLWPSAIALAHDLAARGEAFRGRRVLELGAGTGLPGIVAASLGAKVVQTDRQEVALHVCQRNGVLNGIGPIDYRQADWTAWDDGGTYDWIVGSDILYADTVHPNLQSIFDRNLAAGGSLLLADPFRDTSYRFLESLQQEGWQVTLTKWTIGEAAAARGVGVFELRR